MNVILSIKPKYCDEISKGRKKYEFRRKIFSLDTKLVYMYSTAPVKKIVGTFSVKSIIENNPKVLWDNYRDFSCLKETEFFNYFDGMEKGFAIEIKDVRTFKPFNPEVLIPNFYPPQSYRYVKTEECVQQISDLSQPNQP